MVIWKSVHQQGMRGDFYYASWACNDDFADRLDPNRSFPENKPPPPPPPSCDCVLPVLERKDQAGEAGLGCSATSKCSFPAYT